MKFDVNDLFWINEPKEYVIFEDKIEIITESHTDLWQRTYYNFRNDNAPVLQIKTKETEFSFCVRVYFESNHNFDQAGVVMYLDSENWIKASVEYGRESGFLGSVVTNHGYSDWSTTKISSSIKSIWFRLSRRGKDFCVEKSNDGEVYDHIRICHMFEATDEISFGVYAASPEDGAFRAVFDEFLMSECKWAIHQGQQPDVDLG